MNTSTLVKLGALGAVAYMMSSKGNSKTANANAPVVVDNAQPAEKETQKSGKSSPFMFGKELAGKLLGKKI
ncbi:MULTISPECIES: hypothetical protein [unclassified Moraxella]|uniref:hypothetical protein n=1 Tax=unclassified Moraxella TaxID=2685852 RepID=UPI003AF8BC4A